MTQSAFRIRRRRSTSDAAPWVRRHHRQIGGRSADEWSRLSSVYALTFRPSGHAVSFGGKLLRPAGAALAVVVSYNDDDDDLSPELRMPVAGFRSEACDDGSLIYGGVDKARFVYEGAVAPQTRGGRVACPPPSPGLAELVLQLDSACAKRALRGDCLPVRPQLPGVYLAFAQNDLPKFEVTPALCRLAARKLGLAQRRLGANGDVLLDRYLHDLWESLLLPPKSANNPTETALISAEFCTQGRRALLALEDFSGLVGVRTWNPARGVQFLTLPNPAAEVLQRFGIDRSQDFCQAIPAEVVVQLEVAMRESIGALAGRFTPEELLDGLTGPDRPLVAWSEALPRLRAKLTPSMSECTTDADLLQAARQPNDALVASGACRFQILRRRPSEDALHFMPEDLDRRIEADFRPEASAHASHHQPPIALVMSPMAAMESAVA